MASPASVVTAGKPRRRRERGVVLIVVLWIVVLLSVSSSALTTNVRLAMYEVRNRVDHARAEWAARGGVAYTAWWLRHGRASGAGGELPLRIRLDDMRIELDLDSVHGRVDLNRAGGRVLRAALLAAGAEPDAASRIADAILDWRDPDRVVRANGAEDSAYRRAGRPYRPANRSFRSISELQRVLGITPRLYHRLRSMLTLHSGASRPRRPFAAPGLAEALLRQGDGSRTQVDDAGGMKPRMRRGPHVINVRVRLRPGRPVLAWWAEIRARGNGRTPYELLSWKRTATVAHGGDSDRRRRQ